MKRIKGFEYEIYSHYFKPSIEDVLAKYMLIFCAIGIVLVVFSEIYIVPHL